MAYIPPIDREIKDFYRTHCESVYRGCTFLAAGRADPAELTRQVFWRLLKKGYEFTSDADAKAWMLMQAARLCKKGREEKNGEEAAADPFAGLRRLSMKDRLTALLYYCEGMRKADIAACYGRPGFAVSRRLKRIKGIFRDSDASGLLRRDIREPWQSIAFPLEQREAILEEILSAKPDTSKTRGGRWHPRGQWSSWLFLLAVLALVLGCAWYAADKTGLTDQAAQLWSGLQQKLKEARQTEPPTEPSAQPPQTMGEAGDPEAAYGEILAKYVTAIEEGWDFSRCDREDINVTVSNLESPTDLRYALLDLDRDGTEELLISDGSLIYDLYAVEEGQVIHVLRGAERNAYALTRDMLILNTGSNGAASTVYTLYRYFSGNLIVDTQVIFDAAQDPENPWFRGYGTPESSSPITEEEAQAFLDANKPVALNLPDITAFPQ